MVNKKFLLLAVLLGLVTTLAVNLYIKKQVRTVKEDVPLYPVVVAATNIKSRDVITKEMVTLKYLPKEYILPDAVTDVTQAIDKVNSSVLIPGEQLLKSKIKEKGASLGLSFKIPPNKRAVSVKVMADTGIAGLLQPGDLVDVLVTFTGINDGSGEAQMKTITVLQKVQILAIDQTTEFTGDDSESKSSYSGAVITFALTLDEAERLTLANKKGEISLALRSFNDTARVNTSGVDLREVMSASRYSSRSTGNYSVRSRAASLTNVQAHFNMAAHSQRGAADIKASSKNKKKVEVIRGTQQDIVIWDNP